MNPIVVHKSMETEIMVACVRTVFMTANWKLAFLLT